MQFSIYLIQGYRLRKIVSSLILSYCCLIASAPATVVVIVPDGTANYGSGLPIEEKYYYPGGLPGMGPFIGNPNDSVRHDRAIFRYDISRFLLAPEKITKAEFFFSVHTITAMPRERKVRIDHFLHQLEALESSALSEPDVETASDVPISDADMLANNGAPKRIDVTKLIQNDLYQGFLSTTFRFLDLLVETPGLNNGTTSGVSFRTDKDTIPQLRITTTDSTD
jgi:hypothetical protein